MAGITWRQRALAAAASAVTGIALAATLAACGAKGDPTAGSGAATNQADSALGGAPTTPSGANTASAAPTSAAGAGGNNNGPTYPKDAKGYVQELVRAMARPDYTRISQLAVQSAVQQLKDSITAGGNPNSQWPHLVCTENTAPNQSTCVARNSHGDELTVKINQSQLGFPTAVTEAPLERTQYPSAPGSYANAFMNAWANGNQQRMARLSSDSIKTYFVGQGAALSASSQYPPEPAGTGYVKVQFTGLSGDSGRDYTVKVAASPGGKANSIKGYCKGFNCTFS
jgi:hypothetical protein